jgi:hypothetical protein
MKKVYYHRTNDKMPRKPLNFNYNIQKKLEISFFFLEKFMNF